jgi:hypothetical protein
MRQLQAENDHMKNELLQYENDAKKRDYKSGLNSLEESNP